MSIREWFDEGVAQQATHMIVVCDTFDHEDYPVYVLPDEDFWLKYDSYDGHAMQRIMEVYDLRQDKAEQLSERRSHRTPPRTSTGASDG